MLMTICGSCQIKELKLKKIIQLREREIERERERETIIYMILHFTMDFFKTLGSK